MTISKGFELPTQDVEEGRVINGRRYIGLICVGLAATFVRW